MGDIPAAPIEPAMPLQQTQLDAFSSAMTAADAALRIDPDTMGAGLAAGLDRFNTRESSFRATVEQAMASPATATDSTDINAATPGKLTSAQALEQADAMHRRSMGLMMQTYSFALEATLVTNAATTFTSSINTLIKTQ